MSGNGPVRFRHTHSIPRVALLGDNASKAAQATLETKVQQTLDRFTAFLGYPERDRIISIADRRFDELVHSEFVLSGNALGYQDQMKAFFSRYADPTWRIEEVRRVVPSIVMPSKPERIHTLSIIVPAQARRDSCWTLARTILGSTLGLGLVFYLLFILLGS